MILEACTQTGTKPEDIDYMVIAANTVMQHLITGYSPVSMGVAPFTTTSLFGEELPAWEGLPASKNIKIYYTPAISAYVGGDITAGLLAAGFENINDPAIFLDIGTNGEIVLKHENIYYCCATAAGPAFEGAEITMGMAAEPGAIDHVKLKNNFGIPTSETRPPQNSTQTDFEIEYSTIGDSKPKGLCGSGLLDILAVLLDIGAVDETGRLDREKFHLTPESEANVNDSVYVTAGDIRKLQLAKAAIAAGIQVLLHFAGIEEKDIKLLALAGGFGSYMDLNSAARIGLFPKSLLPVAKTYGNTAGEGAAQTITDKNALSILDKINAQCQYIELSSIAFFNDKFIDEMAFEES